MQSVETYGYIADTGNSALDILITEKSLYCRENDIRLTCNVRGADFESFDDSDIYSLFGNALSNAIECVSKITVSDRRSICVNSMKKGNVLSLHFENYTDEIPLMKDGMPVTKKDKKYHGFGMKSIKYIVEKYGGEMVCEAVDNRFVINMIFNIKQ